MHERPRRTFGYCRVSSQAQGDHGTSLDAQREEIERFCRASGFPTPRIFIETESGGEKAERRVEQVKLMGEVRAGDLVIFAKIDRWSRHTLYSLSSWQEIQSRGARVLSLAERFDPSTPEGRFAATMMAANAEMERQRIFDRTVGTRRRLRNMGKSVEGHCPYGYRREARTLVVWEPEARLIRMAYALCLDGLSLMQIRARLSAEGLKRDKQVIHKYLRDRTYLGEMKDTHGVWHAAHPALVGVEDFEAVGKTLAARRLDGRRPSPLSATARWLLRGLAVCARCGRRCGSSYSPRIHRDPLAGYYVCNGRLRRLGCEAGRAPVRATDEAASKQVFERLTQIRQALAATPQSSSAKPEPVGHERERAELVAKRRRVVDLTVAGTINFEEARQRTSKIDADIRELDALEEAQRRTRAAEEQLRRPAERRALLADVGALSRAWKKTTTEERREVLSLLAETISLDGDALTLRWRKVVDMMSGSQPSAAFYRRCRLRELAKARRKA